MLNINLKNHLSETVKKYGMWKARKLISRPVMNEFRLIYNEICDKCKSIVKSNPGVPLEAYCKDCQPSVEKRLQKIQELINK